MAAEGTKLTLWEECPRAAVAEWRRRMTIVFLSGMSDAEAYSCAFSHAADLGIPSCFRDALLNREVEPVAPLRACDYDAQEYNPAPSPFEDRPLSAVVFNLPILLVAWAIGAFALRFLWLLHGAR